MKQYSFSKNVVWKTAFFVLFLCLLFPPMESAQETSSKSAYHNYAELTKAVKNLEANYSQVVKLLSIGKTVQGRDVWLLRLSGIEGSPLEKQALFIAANLEGDHLIGSEVALGIAENLASNYGKNAEVTAVLDKRTFYIVPRLNPDGAEAFFNDVKIERSENFNPRDEDYDWRIDEDGPEDLDGNGFITKMRVKDKDGDWIIDEKDPRLMKKKEPGTPLDKLYTIYTEGIDNDGDGLYNEDAPGGFNINRNFPHNFGYKPKGLKVYPASEVETQALIGFMTRYDPQIKTQPHLNICGVLVFSTFDNLAGEAGIECGTPVFPEPPQSEGPETGGRMMRFFRMGRRGGDQAAEQPRPTDPQSKKTDGRDLPLFRAVSEKYKELTGITSTHSENPFGSLLEYAYFQYGVPSFSANLWSFREEKPAGPPSKRRASGEGIAEAPPAKARTQMPSMDRSAMMQRFLAMRQGGAQGGGPAPSSDVDAKWLKWIDEKNEGRGFIPWTSYEHEQLGTVEIGGFVPYLRVNPPQSEIPELVKNHTAFSLFLAGQFAEIRMNSPEVEKLSSNLYRLTVKVVNHGEFPYCTNMGERTRNVNPILIRLHFEDDKKMELFGGNKRVDLNTLDAGGEKEYKWLIISPPGKKVDVTLWARKGGGAFKKTAILK
ncbi:MAG: hypothetical protein JXB26_13995 [Candidatus Aminicenantes bacterium]|nr:hypothetical protein [Candidatus Aminicenantes bacterium]